MAERLVLVDGSSLIFRAYFAIPANFRTSGGLPTNAVYGFALMFRKLLAAKLPARAAVVFDAPGETFRSRDYPEYKAQRPTMPDELRVQLPWIDRVVEAFAWPVIRLPGYEADDVIGTLTAAAVARGHEVRIIAGDKDFAQLIGPQVRMIDTMRDVTFDEEVVRKKWGVLPHQFIDYLALCGDAVDNIPGVPGIGAKTAAELLATYGTLDAVLASTAELKGKKRENLEAFAEQARISRHLATILTDAPVPLGLDDLTVSPPDPARVDALYRELEFWSLLSSGSSEPATAAGDYRVARGEDAATWLASLGDVAVAVIPVTETARPVFGPLLGVGVGAAEGHGRFLPWDDATAPVITALLADATRTKILHGAEGLATWRRMGLTVAGVVGDTGLGSFLVDPTGLIPHRLDQVVKQYLQRTLPPLKDLLGSGKSVRKVAEVPENELARWASHTAAEVAAAWPKVAEKVEALGQTACLRDVDLPLSHVLAEMTATGIRVDVDAMRVLGEAFAAELTEVDELIFGLAGKRFNLGSTQQLGAVLFEDLGLPTGKSTKTGWSTSAEVLEKLMGKHPIIDHILRRRTLAKLIDTYTDVLQREVQPETGRVHATFQQTVGASGRLITTDPDLQRTPIRTPESKRIRAAFLPQEGWVMISADWSQIELRVLAHMCRDPLLVSSFAEGVDVHRRTASEIYGVPPDQVTPTQRNVGKTVNFATIYGQGATALAQQLGISRKEAVALIDTYFARYAGVRAWLDETIARATADGVATTLLGRRRVVHELSSNNPTDRAYGERIAANTPIQGSAADLCKLAMLGIHRDLRAAGLDTRLLLQIHDELVLEAPANQVEASVAIVRRNMERVWPLAVPLVVDVGVGGSWADAH